MNFVMWTKHFFESQVKVINQGSKLKPLGKDRKNEQDDTSAIQLEHNDWKSRSNRQTTHFDI